MNKTAAIDNLLETLPMRVRVRGVLLDKPRDETEDKVVGAYHKFEKDLREQGFVSSCFAPMYEEILAMADNYQLPEFEGNVTSLYAYRRSKK